MLRVFSQQTRGSQIIVLHTQLGYYHTHMSNYQINLSDVLFSKVRQKLLGLLYGQPYKDFHTNELIRLTQMGSGVVQRELKKLLAGGLLTVKQLGNQKRYQAN